MDENFHKFVVEQEVWVKAMEELDLRPLVGIRALACMAVVFGHCMMLQGYTHPNR